MNSLLYSSYIVVGLLLIFRSHASANSEFTVFSPMVTSWDVSDINPVGREAHPQAIPGPGLFSLADDTLLQTDIKSPCLVGGSNLKARIRSDDDVCKPEVEKKPMVLPLDIYDPQKVMDSLENPDLQDDYVDWKSVEEFQKKQDQYRAWNDFLTDDNPNKCQNQENPYYDIHVCCKGPFGNFNGLFFDWAEGCSLSTFPSFIQFKPTILISFFPQFSPAQTAESFTICAACGTLYVNRHIVLCIGGMRESRKQC